MKKLILLIVILLCACKQSLSAMPLVTPTSFAFTTNDLGSKPVPPLAIGSVESTFTAVLPTNTSVPTVVSTGTPVQVLPTGTPVAIMTQTLVAASATPLPKFTSVPTQQFSVVATTTGNVIVVTATGMSDLGALLDDQPMTPVVSGLIDWDHLKLYTNWEKDKGLTKVDILYFQTGVPNEAPIPSLRDGDDVFLVPSGYVLMFGAYSASVTFQDGRTDSRTEGFYNAFEQGTGIKELSLTDGFALIVKAEYAQQEYCARVGQAMTETPPWAHKNLYVPKTWPKEFCKGVYATPNDSDR